MSYVLNTINLLREDQWAFGTLPDRSNTSLAQPNIKMKVNSLMQSPHAQALKTKVNGLMQTPHAQTALHAAAALTGSAKSHPKDILAHAVTTSLYHVAGLDFPSEVHDAIHHEIHHLSDNLSVATGRAHQALTHMVGKLKSLRSGVEDEHDKELDELIDKLHKVLKHIEPHYRDKK